MRRAVVVGIAGLAFVGLASWVFRGVLGGEQFGYRDATHHYYPLYLRVQQEWGAGRVPLWDPWENGGQPLLGNPTAAVFYPGKLVFAALPYPAAARAYVLLHVAIAFGAMVWFLRGIGASGVAATIGALSYSYGAPVLFQYSNVIYLVGAAWLPLGLRSVVDWVRFAKPGALAALAAVLAMETLGGDPQVAYLTVVAGIGYAACLGDVPGRGGSGKWILGGFLGLVGLGFLASAALPSWRRAVEGLPVWWPSGRSIWAVFVLGGGVWWLRKSGSGRARRVIGLAAAGALGLGIAAAQVLPVAEFAVGSRRGSAGRGLDAYGFSLAPYRVAELAWPNVTGASFPRNHSWTRSLPPATDHTFWTPSLYLGGLTLVLAVGGLGSFGNRPVAGWLTALIVIGLFGAFGKFGGPIGIADWFPPWDGVASALGGGERGGMFLAEADSRAGDGSPYWFLSTFLPGFDLFRYPSKLLTFVAFGVSALGAVGWDRATAGSWKRPVWAAGTLLVLGLSVEVLLLANRGAVLSSWESPTFASPEGGPLDAVAALARVNRALQQGSIVLAIAIGVVLLASKWRRPALAGGLAIGFLAVDLGLANGSLVWTVPQQIFEAEPAALKVIREAEAERPASGPFRIHRVPAWHPFGMFLDGSDDRLDEVTAWERDTLQPLHGLPLGVSYTLTLGVLENEEYLRAFLPELRAVGPGLASTIGKPPEERALFFPRRAFDAWNSRYFVLPVDPTDWRSDDNRAYIAFLDGVEVIAPRLEAFETEAERAAWRLDRDWQVFRNPSAMPRAWAVHEAQVSRPFPDLSPDEQVARLRSLFGYPGPLGAPGGIDLRRIALVEAEDPSSLRLDLGQPSTGEDSVEIERYEPTEVVIEAKLASPGLIVLADMDAPGWRLSLDGEPAPILRANHAMRAAAVPLGRHRLVYRYEPAAFKVGLGISAVSILIGAGLVAESWRRRLRIGGTGLEARASNPQPE